MRNDEPRWDAEAEAIDAALKAAGNNKVMAVEMLGIHRNLLYRRMKDPGITGSSAEGELE